MRSFQTIGGYFSAVKQKIKIKSKIQAFWHRDGVQATYQGLTAPIYSFASFKNLVSSSEDLKTSLLRASTENVIYAAQALILYFVYYRTVHPVLNEYQEEAGSNSWVGWSAKGVIQTIDMSLYICMCVYLMTRGWQNSAQNILLTSTITTTAGNAMRPNPDFKPCDAKDCGAITVARAGLDSTCFYLANRYLVNKISWDITHSIPGLYGKAAAFVIEAVSIGLPLVEYKFSGQCTMHKYKELLGSYKTYCIMYGASFVAATWVSYGALSRLSGEGNPYIYTAVYSLLFQLYVVLSIARDKKLPGNDHVNIDIMAWLTYFAKQSVTQYVLNFLLGPLTDLEKFVQTPGAGIAIAVYDNEIKQGITSARDGIQHARNFQNNRVVTTLRWVNTWFPYQFIPEGLTIACKSVRKTALSRFLRRIEYLIDIGRDAEIQRNAQLQQPIHEEIANHFGPPDERLNAAQPEEAKSRVAPEQAEIKPADPREDKIAEQKLDAIFQAADIVVNSHYFIESKEIESKNPPSSISRSLQGPTLFSNREGGVIQRNTPRTQSSLASITASIITNTARTRALR